MSSSYNEYLDDDNFMASDKCRETEVNCAVAKRFN